MKFKTLITNVLLSFAFTAQAAPLYVDGTTGLDSRNCATIATACKTPWRAYSVAAVGDEILITKGTYTLPAGGHYWISKAVAFKGGYDSTFEPLLARSKSAEDTILTGNNAQTYRLFVLTTGHTNWVTFDTLTITGAANVGNHSGALLTHMDAAVSPNDGAWLRLNNVTIRDIKMHTGSGAIEVTRSGDKLEIINSRFINNQASATGGAIALANKDVSINADVSIKDSSFITNKAQSNGGAIYIAESAQVNLTIQDSIFSANEGSRGGAIALLGTVGQRFNSVTIDRSSFTANKSSNHGGAVFTENGIWNITNSTFSGNTSVNNIGGAFGNTGALTKFRYVSIVNNSAGGSAGGLGVWWDGRAEAEIEASIITGNKVGSVNYDIGLYNSSKIVDLGYNLIGSLGDSNFYDFSNSSSIDFRTWFKHKVNGDFTSKIITGSPETVVELTAKDNGGKHGVYTNKLIKNGEAYNAIPNQGALFYGAGQSAQYPFTHTEQVGSVINREGYGAGTYFFDLGGNYDKDNNFAYSPGSVPSLVFSTYIDENGYILVASSSRNNVSAGAYSQTDELVRRTDNILREQVITSANFAVSEVRISSYSNRQSRGTFDGYSKNSTVINNLKQFKPLSSGNSFDWVTTTSSSGKNYFAGNNGVTVSDTLAQSIYHSAATDAISWTPKNDTELLTRSGATTPNDDLDLWIKNSGGVCDGTVSTDARGLPRSDRVKDTEPFNQCDVGAFEFNDYFTVDCEDEDGMRPENSITNASASWCVNPFDKENFTPQSLIENMGAFQWYWSLLLIGLYGIRRKLKN